MLVARVAAAPAVAGGGTLGRAVSAFASRPWWTPRGITATRCMQIDFITAVRRMTTAAPPMPEVAHPQQVRPSPSPHTADEVVSEPVITPVPVTRPQSSARAMSAPMSTPTDPAITPADSNPPLTKKNVVVRRWSIREMIELVTSISEPAIELLRVHYNQPATWHPPSFPVMPTTFTAWCDPALPNSTKLNKRNGKVVLKGKHDQQYFTRQAEVSEYARELRMAIELEPHLHKLGTHMLIGNWLSRSGLAQSTGRSIDALRIYFDIMSDPRTHIKPHLASRENRLHAVDAEGQPVDRKRTKHTVGPTVKPAFRAILRYIFFHKLPKGEGTWMDACRHLEALAWNADEIRQLKESMPEHNKFLQQLESDAKLSTPYARKRAIDTPMSDPPVGLTPFQQLALQMTASSADASSPSSTAPPESTTKPLNYPITLAPFPPSLYKIPIVRAQGRAQGFTHERSVRSALAFYPEFVVQKKARVTVVPKLITTRLGATPTTRNLISRSTNVYALNLDMLQKLLHEERQWSQHMSHEEHEAEFARIRRARKQTATGLERINISQSEKNTLDKQEAAPDTQPTTAGVIEV